MTEARRAMIVRKKQCKACPWRRDVLPAEEIPNGYCRAKHANLERTIAEPGVLSTSDTLRLMACHESVVGREYPCVGWLANQLGSGHNMALRFLARDGRFRGIRTVGAQCETLQETLRSE